MSERRFVSHVGNLDQALDAYWNADNHREEQAAYHEILLFGGKDDWSCHGSFRSGLIRVLRRIALWIDQRVDG